MDQDIPEFLVLDIADLVRDFESKWNQTLTYNPQDLSFKPDMLRIVKNVINSVRQEEDAELELATMAYSEIAAMAHYEITQFGDVEKYNQLHLALTNLTVQFGKAIIARFKQEGIYHNGFLPYKFRGWVGSTVYVSYDCAQGCSATNINGMIRNAHIKNFT